MTKTQQIKLIKDKIKVYKDDRFVNLKQYGSRIYAINRSTGNRHIFVDGLDYVQLPKGVNLEDLL